MLCCFVVVVSHNHSHVTSADFFIPEVEQLETHYDFIGQPARQSSRGVGRVDIKEIDSNTSTALYCRGCATGRR